MLLFFGFTAFASAADRPPNVLFAIADDWGRDAGAYGTKWIKTPAFDRVAREGLLFTRAYTPNAKCAPSRACILTGRNPWQLKAAANHIPYFPTEFKGWMEALGDNGWFSGHTQKGWGPGVATNVLGKPRQMTGRAFNARKFKPPTSGISNNDYAANFAEFLDAAPTDKPWCFWAGFIEPHREYEFGSGGAKGGKKLSDIDRVPAYWPDNETVRNDMLDYAFEVEHVDRHLGRMLVELEKRGLLSNTLVVVTSDHGMPFPRVKGQTYEHANHLPLAIMWPRGITRPGRVVDDFVSVIDFAPTFIGVAGMTWNTTGMQAAQGRSLTEIFRSEKSGRVIASRDHVLIGRERQDVGRPNDGGYPVRGIVTEEFLYLHNFAPDRWPSGNPETGYLDTDGGATKTFILQSHRENSADKCWQLCFGKRPSEELYNVANDPDCVKNLADSAESELQRERLKTQLFAELKAQGDPRMFGQGDVFDRYEHAQKNHVGFYERFMRGEKLKAGWVNETDFERPAK
jgi:N-sulfoglucosamine sulfohydrolase